MEQNTIQIQHINLECPIAEFGFNRFLLTFFIRYRVLNSNAFRPGIGPQRYSLVFYHVGGSPNCWTSNCPACSKIEGGFKSQSIEIYWSEQRSALGCLSDQRLTEKQHQGNISQHIYRYVSTCVIFSLAARTVQRSSNILLPLFPLGPWYRMFSQCVLLCFLCACSFFKHYVTLHSTMYQKTHQLQLIALYSQQAL